MVFSCRSGFFFCLSPGNCAGSVRRNRTPGSRKPIRNFLIFFFWRVTFVYSHFFFFLCLSINLYCQRRRRIIIIIRIVIIIEIIPIINNIPFYFLFFYPLYIFLIYIFYHISSTGNSGFITLRSSVTHEFVRIDWHSLCMIDTLTGVYLTIQSTSIYIYIYSKGIERERKNNNKIRYSILRIARMNRDKSLIQIDDGTMMAPPFLLFYIQRERDRSPKPPGEH